jgi:hypothetical protein
MLGTLTKRVKLVVSMIIALTSLFGFRYGLAPMFEIDIPEYGPGSIFFPTGVYMFTASASPTAPSTPSHSGARGHAGAIAGGGIGGIAIISIVVASIFYLQRRRSQTASAGVCASQPMPVSSSGPSVPGSSMIYFDD